MEKRSGKSILVVLGWPLKAGGHISSTLTFIRELKKSGFHVHVAAPGGPREDEFRQECGVFLRLSGPFLWHVFKLWKYSLRNHIDIFWAADYVAMLRVAAIRMVLKRLVVFIKAGGLPPPYRMPPAEHLVVFSQELVDGILAREADCVRRLSLISARIDQLFFAYQELPSQEEYLRLFMAVRLTSSKRFMLDNLFEQIHKDTSKRLRLCLIGSGELEGEFREKAKVVNEAMGQTIIEMPGEITDPQEIRHRIYQCDIAVGHGRGILEPMACGRPAILLGKGTHAALLKPDNIQRAAEFNFSGRHYKDSDTETLGDIVQKLDWAELRRLGRWSSEYVAGNLSAEAGGKQIVQMLSQPVKMTTRREFLKWLWRR